MKTEQIVIRTGDPLSEETDGLIHPISGTNLTREAARFPELLEMLDPEALQMLRTHEPLTPGGVVITPAGELPCRLIAHLPIEHDSNPSAGRDSLRTSLEAGLYALDQQACESCLIPGVTPTSGPTPNEKVRAGLMLNLLLGYAPGRLNRILLVDENQGWIRTLNRQRKRIRASDE